MAEKRFSHKPVLLKECIGLLGIKPSGVYIDATMGLGGHSEEILKRLGSGRLLGIDRDPDAIAAASQRLAVFGERFLYVKSNYSDIDAAAARAGIEKADGILFDLGVSSYQLDNPDRGFSYTADAALDMRMDNTAGITAEDVVNGYEERELERILREYGEERFSKSVAAAITAARGGARIETTARLSDIITSAIPAGAAHREKQHPAKRSFQAIRIEVNGELDAVRTGVAKAVEMLRPGGRICVITFHSLEDRIVKQCFAGLARGCICPRDFPVCVCGRKPEITVLTKKPVTADECEIDDNPRSRSAKLRAAEKN